MNPFPLEARENFNQRSESESLNNDDHLNKNNNNNVGLNSYHTSNESIHSGLLQKSNTSQSSQQRSIIPNNKCNANSGTLDEQTPMIINSHSDGYYKK